MFNGFHNGMGAGGWVLMVVLWVMVLALVVWVVARLWPARSAAHQEFRKGPAEGPREILDGRLARGELDVQAYEELRGKLDSRSPTGTG